MRPVSVALALSFVGLAAWAAPAPPAAAPAPVGTPAFTISEPGKVRGEQEGPGGFVMNDVKADCGQILFKGRLKDESTTLGLSPEFYKCEAGILSGLSSDFYHDYACDFVLYGLRAIDGARWHADVDIRCPQELGAFAFEIYEARLEFDRICAIWIASQRDAGSATIRNLHRNREGIEVRWNLSGIEYELATPVGSGASLLCGSLPGNTGTGATYRATAAVFAHDRQSGRPIELRMTEGAPGR